MKNHLMTLSVLMTVSIMFAAGYASAAPSVDESSADATTVQTQAASTVKSKAKVKAARKANDSNIAGQTDIVANVDMPMVTNILPWQEKEGKIPKDILEFSALKDSLTPTDRDRLASEIRYTAILNEPVNRK